MSETPRECANDALAAVTCETCRHFDTGAFGSTRGFCDVLCVSLKQPAYCGDYSPAEASAAGSGAVEK